MLSRKEQRDMADQTAEWSVQIANSRSCQPCGCDIGASWVCKVHQQIETPINDDQEADVNDAATHVQHAIPNYSHLAKWVAPVGIKDSGERITYSSGSMRDPSTGKIKWSRVTFGPMLRRWAMHLTNAEAKYPDPTPGVPNFTLIETEEERIRYKESALRHFMSWFYEETDEDHAAAVFFNINGVGIIDEKRKAKESK